MALFSPSSLTPLASRWRVAWLSQVLTTLSHAAWRRAVLVASKSRRWAPSRSPLVYRSTYVLLLGDAERATELPRHALMRPRSLAPEQYAPVRMTVAKDSVPIDAWVTWEDGVEECVGATDQAVAASWTSRAVLVRWGPPPHVLEAWAGAASRR